MSVVELFAQLLARLEEWYPFGFDMYRIAGSRVTPGARITLLDREGAKTPEPDPVPPGQRRRDFSEYGVDYALHIPVIQMRIFLRNLLDQFRLYHVPLPVPSLDTEKAVRCPALLC